MTPTGAPPSGSSPRPTQPADLPAGGFSLAGPSTHPDPRTHAYRQDLADVALAGAVIASHYAIPLPATLARESRLHAAPDAASETLAALATGTEVRLLDKSRGWAWGYAGDEVGYIPLADFH